MSYWKEIAGGNYAFFDDDGSSRKSCGPDGSEYLAWVAAGNTPTPRDAQEVATEVAAAAQAEQDRADARAIRADNKFQSLISKTPQQAKNWVDNNFPSLTDPERKDLSTIVIAIGVLGRSL